jgi:hypothetical protein
MTDVRIATTDGTGKVLESAAVQAFRDELRGPLIGPEDTNYDERYAQSKGLNRVQPAAVSCPEISSVTRARVSGSVSSPPSDRGVNIRSKPASCSAANTGGDSRRSRSAS